MKSLQLIAAVIIGAALVAPGCSSSKKTTEATQIPPPATETQTGGKIDQKVDTVSVGVQNNQKPSYDTPPTTGTRPLGRFSVQIGAYQMSDNADRIASLAKERFGMTIYTFLDKKDNLYKVMIGDFTTKDDARRFRDDMVQKFPSDYKDAWVSENMQN